MKAGDKVICIDKDFLSHRRYSITNGNIYTVESPSLTSIMIVNDKGVRVRLYRERFILLSEYREDKLNEIGI